MIVQMDKMSAPPGELAQRLYEKNVELENSRRRSAKARVPSDPNAWQQMRENFEAIMLEDHAFSEQHNIEYALWQLHYKRIEEFRAHLSASQASGSATSHVAKGPNRPDRATKIRMQFKAFLSEATGFYHDLILKIRAKYGLPLGHFSEESENQIVMEKDGQKHTEMKKGLISCHRCLIYLGDLARYKGLYGEGESKSRDYTAASSYYLQASSLWPSSGNPHNQLAILASYSGDELVSVYRYFRSLAVDSPFSTARDNLIVAFEKNRQAYSQLLGDPRSSGAKESAMLVKSKGRGKVEARVSSKETKIEANVVNGAAPSMHEIFKSFCVRFVRLNGILFTRTSLETFAEVLSLVSSGLDELLSSGPEEELNLGKDAVDNGLILVRLVAILIFTVHNVNRETEGQSYAEILQRKVLLQNAFTAIFEFMGHVLRRCVELRDTSSSYLLPGILVFMEWLASRQDVASCSDVEDRQATVRSIFWKNCISFLNKMLSNGLVTVDDEDETCFFNMSTYEEGETENRLALWEDIELRGFLPLLPAQTILDFSRKHSLANDGGKEKKARMKRILAAGKVVTTVVRVDDKAIFFDSKLRRFSVGVEPKVLGDKSEVLNSNGALEGTRPHEIMSMENLQLKEQIYVEAEDEDEVIVFKPLSTEKRHDAGDSTPNPYGGDGRGQNAYAVSLPLSGDSVSSGFNNLHQQAALDSISQPLITAGNTTSKQQQVAQAHTSKWLEHEAYLSNGMKGLGFLENGHANLPVRVDEIGMSHPFPHSYSLAQQSLQDVGISFPYPLPQSLPEPSLEEGISLPFVHQHSHNQLSINNLNVNGVPYGQMKAPGTYTTSRAGSIMPSGSKSNSSNANMAVAMSENSRKSPVSRPHRHLGPPPGFNHPPKQVNASTSASDLTIGSDDYSWLDGYQLPLSSSSTGLNSNYPSIQTDPPISNVSNCIPGMTSFPFPGKQVPRVQSQFGNQNVWPHHVPVENVDKLQQGQPLQYLQQFIKGNQQLAPLPEQYQGNSSWTGRHIV